jgi:peptide deformylase
MIKLSTPRKVENAKCNEFSDIEDVKKYISNDFVNEMTTFCYMNRGIGLAGPQIGINKKFFVAFSPTLAEWKLYINPKYKPMNSDEKTQSNEGCLTYGTDKYLVTRYPKIIAEWQKVTRDNEELKTITRELEGLEAVVFQHETDHCEGITIAMIGEKVK